MLSNASTRGAIISARHGFSHSSLGDPGPSSAFFLRSLLQNRRNASTVSSKQKPVGRDLLNNLLDSDQPIRVSRKRLTPIPDQSMQDGLERKNRRDVLNRRASLNNIRTVGPPKPIANSDSYRTSERLRRLIDTNALPGAIKVEKAIKLVYETPKEALDVPVWNMLFALIGRHAKLDLMWRTFNDMKKRGFEPSSRTFTTLINAYAGVNHSSAPATKRTSAKPEQRTLSRVGLIYEQARTFMAKRLEERDDVASDLGLALGPSESQDRRIVATHDHELSNAPTNAYLKFLARYGMYEEMQRIVAPMPATGPLSPDNTTFNTMFSALLSSGDANAHDKHRADGTPSSDRRARNGNEGEARQLWDRACRQLDGQDGRQVMDEDLALIALTSLCKADGASQRLAKDLVPLLWHVSPPGKAVMSSNDLAELRKKHNLPSTLPRFDVTVKAATVIISHLPHPNDRAHYAQAFLHHPTLAKGKVDMVFLTSAVRAYSTTGEVHEIISIFDSYQPTGPNNHAVPSWPTPIWNDALTAARWSTAEGKGMRNEPDFTTAIDIFRRMTHLPLGVEAGLITGPYVWAPPNGRHVDVRGLKWMRPVAQIPDAKTVSLLLKTSLGRGWRESQQAFRIFRHCQEKNIDLFRPQPNLSSTGRASSDREGSTPTKGNKKNRPQPGSPASSEGSRLSRRNEKEAIKWAVELAKDVIRVIERISEREAIAGEKKELDACLQQMKRIVEEDSNDLPADERVKGTMK